MRKHTTLAFVSLLFLQLASTHAAEVTDLRCEYRENPLGVDVAKPRLSWMMAGPGQATWDDSAARHEAPPRQRVLFNEGWRFQKGDPGEVGASLTYDVLKPWLLAGTAGIVASAPKRPEGEAPGEKLAVVQPAFNDSAWRALNLPHDWGVEGPFQQALSGSTAKLPWSGVGWYRKHFTVEAATSPRNYHLDIDGAMSFAAVWCNGKFVGGWPCGYASWRLDLTPFIKPGADNTIAVRLDNPEDSSRWYPGGGIYRNVWLESTSPVHAERQGTFITTPEVSSETATIRIETRIVNRSLQPAEVRVVTRIVKFSAGGMAEGPELAVSAEESLVIPVGGTRPVRALLKLAKPRLWDVVTPERYVAVTTVRQEGRIIDRLETPFGIRTAKFTANDGFHLNGKRVPLWGVCLHHDLGSLGAAFNTRAAERQLEMLKEMGCNAIRTSHNPPAPEFLELCDRMGFLVICEFSDTWTVAKTSNGYASLFSDWSEADLRSMIRRDRNHPSVILWSTGNEIGEQTDSDNSLHPVSARLTAIAHEEDPTRSTTVGCDRPESGQNGFQKTVDVFGYNYKPHLYKTFRADNPKQALYGSETASAYSSRGEYLFPPDAAQNDGTMGYHMSSYDVYASGNGYRPEVEFKGQDENPFVAGEFVWTGFDYLGEPTPFYDEHAPSRSSYYGIIDLAGFKKDRFYLYQARWRPELPMAHILPHWNWPERVGQVTPVHVYTSGDEAELFLNGQSLGRRKKGAFEYRLCWDEVKYAPGELKVVAYKNGKEWATSKVKTAGEAVRLRLEADRPAISADGRDLAFLTATVVDKDGLRVPRAMQKLKFDITGPGEIVSTDNGDPTDHTSFHSPERKAFNGHALAIVRAQPGHSAPITVRVISEGLDAAEVRLNALAHGQSQTGAVVQPVELGCEYLKDPLGIDMVKPQLSWKTEVGGQRSEVRGLKQKAYQVLVASSEEVLRKDRGDLWDSGKIESDQSIHVEYQGKPLESRMRCYWKVRVWTEGGGQRSEGGKDGDRSEWSESAKWTMGLLKQGDSSSPGDAEAGWQAQWISDPVLADPTNRPMTPIHCYRSELASRPDAAKWIVLDLGSSRRMDAVDVIPARPDGQSWDFRTPMFPERFKFDVADSRDFKDARTVVDCTRENVPNPRSNNCRFSFPATTARFVRLAVTRLARWDGQDYGLALGGLAVFDGEQSIAVGAGVECSDSLENENWSKRHLVDGKPEVAIAPEPPALAVDIPGVPAQFTVSRVPMLRREFPIDGEIKRAVLSISARGFYEARINGQRVGDELLAPGSTDPNLRLQYQSHDVTALMQRGTNVLGVLLGYGWYAGHMNLFENRCIDGYFPQLLAQLDIELADGRRLTVASDGNWRSTLAGPVRSSDLLDGETCDFRRDMPGWDRPGFDDRTWARVWSQPRDEVALVWQRSQPVRVIREMRPVAVKEPSPGVHVFDFGQELSGWCRLKVDGPAGTHLRLRHAELVDAAGNIDVGNLWGTAQQEDYILDGKGPRVVEPHFTYHGFRYVEVSGLPKPPVADTLVAVNIRSALPDAGHFECSNNLFNRIMETARWTQWNLIFDIPAGCAARSERLGWMGDIRPCVQTACFNMDAAAFLAKYAVDMRDGQKPDGRFTDIAPHAHLRGSEICVGSPGWADAGVSLPWQHWVNYADRRALAEHYASAKRWVDFIHSRNPELLWNEARGMDWGDWLSAGAATPKDLGSTAFFAHSADLVSRMATVLGRTDEAERYRTLFAGIRQAFVKRWVADDGRVGDDTQGSYALALHFNLLDEPLRTKAVERLTEAIARNGGHPTTGFWSSIEMLLALSANGQHAVASRMVALREKPSWGQMAESGTTFWEAFNAPEENLSLNHWTHSAVGEWLWRNVAGINPDEQHPGYERVTIRPRPSAEVSWCKADYESIRGRIAIDWKLEGRKLTMDVTIPPNTTATVHVPAQEESGVTESGMPAAKAAGVKFQRMEDGAAVYAVASGTYAFQSTLTETIR